MGQCFCMENSVDPAKHKNQQVHSIVNDDEVLPVKERSCTDVIFLVLFIVFISVAIYLFSYCIYHGDVYRLTNGYDDCANVCGRPNTNEIDPKSSCKREDMTNKRYLAVTMQSNKVRKVCVENCESVGMKAVLNRCIATQDVLDTPTKTGLIGFFEEVAEDLDGCWKEIVYLSIIALIFSIIILILFRYITGLVIWLLLCGFIITGIIGSICLWILWSETKKKMETSSTESKDNEKKTKLYLTFAIAATVVTIVIILIVLVLRKRIQLVVQLFKEAAKAIHSMPLLLIQPIWTFIAAVIAIGSCIYMILWIESAGFLALENESFYYQKDTTIIVCRWYNLFAIIWFSQFIFGCQDMVIGGAVARWFFTRNKNNLSLPIMTSMVNLIRFHLGTVAFGSLIITIVKMIRALMRYIQNNLQQSNNQAAVCIVKCCICCIYVFEKIIQYVSKNAYIETAIFGYNFCTAAKHAFTIILNNSLRVIAINSVGDFILFIGKALVVIATVLVGIELIKIKEGTHHMWLPICIAGFVAFIISHCFMSVFEMVIDTIFICFCEDCERNDGISRPYYMSRGLMECVQNSRKTLENSDSGESKKQAWMPPKTIS